ncbi:mannosyl-oligosaccharide glucosidase [Nothoprocta perdicaria]|uniref:mannosyl-oligosaccharide glucosidase n=1 Tax=Nothoprocta perdicaria TaxID=30464 RepID=UPI000E1B73C0|nr:mannosyl-oligosaccharide glucosidase [Nothoprocta perdicaria]
MKARAPRALVTGLMWLQQREAAGALRHTCEQGEGQPRYGWLQHDGDAFGAQEIRERGLLLRTEFLKRPGGEHGGDWSWRITALPDPGTGTDTDALLSLFFYVATDGQGTLQPHVEDGARLASVTGSTEELGSFNISFLKPTTETGAEPKYASYHYLDAASPGLHLLTELVRGSLSNAELAAHAAAFERRFEDTFGLARKGFAPAQQRFAQAALSNLLGGVGYFHGRSVLQAEHAEEPVLSAEAELLTAVPSRSFFPRGFLWDEGFHQLLVARWDAALSRDVLAHWLDLMTAEGWIPREQILGEEARARVPPEFVVQRSGSANPPTLFLALQQLLAADAAPLPYLQRLYPRLRAWFHWLNSTQAGALPTAFRWRGRDAPHERLLNPKTLPSGLDDYPRASHPSADERHLDLRCWMALAARVMGDVAERLGEPAEPYRHTQRQLGDNALLERLHWAERLGAFADYGNHSEAVALERRPARADPAAPPQLVRVVRRAPRPQFVDALGYVSLFPLLLQLLQPDSPRLPLLLDALRSEQHLWTPFGLRSLSRASPLYMQRNTEHDPPYWRGPVWVNVNYLALRALQHYAAQAGPQRARAARLYAELRDNLVGNLFRQYRDSGYLWEHYSDSTGRGQGSHPFTGWSALVVLAMAEQY